jgi:hypothetical protein
VIASPPATTATTKEPVEKQAKKPRVDIWTSVPAALDRLNPTIRIEYKYIGADGSMKLRLPKGKEVGAFQNIRLRIDGKSAEWFDPGILVDEPAFSRKESLGPGKSVTLDVPLGKLFKIPEDWKTLEITPTRSEISLLGFTGTLKITDDRKAAEEK